MWFLQLLTNYFSLLFPLSLSIKNYLFFVSSFPFFLASSLPSPLSLLNKALLCSCSLCNTSIPRHIRKRTLYSIYDTVNQQNDKEKCLCFISQSKRNKLSCSWRAHVKVQVESSVPFWGPKSWKKPCVWAWEMIEP